MHANDAHFDALLTRLRATDLTPQERSALQSALVTSLDPTRLRRGLDTLLTDVVRKQDVLRLVWTATAHPDRRAIVHAWIRENFERLVQRTTEEVAVGLASIIGDTCSAQERDAWVNFWRPRAAHTEGVERAIREGEDRSRQCEALGRVVRPALAQWR
jgi:hypothetical protein